MSRIAIRKFKAGTAAFGLWLFVRVALGQPTPEQRLPAAAGSTQQLSAQQLDNLVAPIALYPDPLVGEILAASTYPFEIAEAEQWVQDHPKWKPSKQMSEAKKQSWDPSIKGLVAFPQVLTRLSQDVNWTTQLGDAFLAQQADVMQAIQRMRGEAQTKGKLQTTPQETVTTVNQGGQTAIKIEPANPEVWYVPYYNPVYVWGPPVYGIYPPLLYPGIDIGFGWWPGFDIGLYFGGWGGWGWGGWGWGPNWFGGGIIVNHSFFHRYGFSHFHGDALGSSAWVHDPAHRLGVPYGNREVANRFTGRGGFAGGGFDRRTAGPETRGGFDRGDAGGRDRFGSPGFEQRRYEGNHSVFGGYHGSGQTRIESDHGFSSMRGGFGGGGGFRGGGLGGGHAAGGRR